MSARTPAIPGTASTLVVEPGNGTRYFIVYGDNFVALPDFNVAATMTPHPAEHGYIADKLRLSDTDAREVFKALNPSHITETGTCRHCGRAIVKDSEEGWIDPEAGYDDENGDGIWRTTCDRHDTFIADHEPEEDVRGCSCGMADYGAPGHDGGEGSHA